MNNLLNRLVRDEQGQDLIEYALLAGFISLVAVVGHHQRRHRREQCLRQRQHAGCLDPGWFVERRDVWTPGGMPPGTRRLPTDVAM